MKFFFYLYIVLFPCGQIFAQASKKKRCSQVISIGQSVSIQSKILNEERILNIYLPDNYTTNDSIDFSVIYLLDGSLDEDFIHVAGLIQYNSFPWINVTPNTILVGIANTDRKRDLAFPSSLESERKKYPTAGQSENFMVYLNEEVIPYVEKHYNINKNRTLVGQSLAGLFAAEVLIKHPEMFNNYILISPSVWWSDGSLLKVENAPFPKESAQPLNVYIAVGDEGLAPSENPHIVKDEAKMLFDKIEKIKPATMNMMFDYMPAEDHATIGHLALYNALKFLAPK